MKSRCLAENAKSLKEIKIFDDRLQIVFLWQFDNA